MSSTQAPFVDDILLGPVLASRACGECTVCCTILNINALKKPPNTTCPHCTGHNCGIYESRPQACRDWHCAWRRVSALPDEARPDRLGVAFSLDAAKEPKILFESLFLVGRAAVAPSELEGGAPMAALDLFSAGPLPVFVSWEQKLNLVHPNHALAMAIVNPAASAGAALGPQAQAWLNAYAPLVRRFAPAGIPLLPPGY